MGNKIILKDSNTKRIRLSSSSVTTRIFDKFALGINKYMVIENVISYYSAKCHKALNIIITQRAANEYSEECGEKPHLTISYIKNNLRLQFDKDEFCFENLDEENRERHLFKAVDRISDMIDNATQGQVIPFNSPVEIYAQGGWDRKKGTFEGYTYGWDHKLYGETMYELFIKGIEIYY